MLGMIISLLPDKISLKIASYFSVRVQNNQIQLFIHLIKLFLKLAHVVSISVYLLKPFISGFYTKNVSIDKKLLSYTYHNVASSHKTGRESRFG